MTSWPRTCSDHKCAQKSKTHMQRSFQQSRTYTYAAIINVPNRARRSCSDHNIFLMCPTEQDAHAAIINVPNRARRACSDHKCVQQSKTRMQRSQMCPTEQDAHAAIINVPNRASRACNDHKFAQQSMTRMQRLQMCPCLLYTSPSPRDFCRSRMPSSA